MKKRPLNSKTALLLLLIVGSLPAPVLLGQVQQPLCLVSYNIENLFHPDNDPGDGDDDFTPGEIRGWSYPRYWQKVHFICRVIRHIHGWELPHLIIFCEIENRMVLENIRGNPLLVEREYGIIHRESPDHRGMDVGMLYDKQRLQLLRPLFLPIRSSPFEIQNTREVVGGIFLWDKDTLAVLGLHWSSKYGGTYESEIKRIRQAEQTAHLIDSLRTSTPGIRIVCGGDFNDPIDSNPLKLFERRSGLAPLKPMGTLSSYKYQGRWQSIDHLFISDNLEGQLTLFQPEYLLELDTKYGGLKPFRTWSGFKYQGGISDHLPLVTELRRHREVD